MSTTTYHRPSLRRAGCARGRSRRFRSQTPIILLPNCLIHCSVVFFLARLWRVDSSCLTVELYSEVQIDLERRHRFSKVIPKYPNYYPQERVKYCLIIVQLSHTCSWLFFLPGCDVWKVLVSLWSFMGKALVYSDSWLRGRDNSIYVGW